MLQGALLIDLKEMLATEKTKSVILELTDTAAAEVCAGLKIIPQTTGSSGEDDNTLPPAGWDGGIGLMPFLPPLPGTKLHRLGILDPTKRTSPKNSITISIPIPAF